MSDKMREMFEARFTVPPGVYWNDDRQRYATHYHESLRMAERQRDLWKAWQAAHAAALPPGFVAVPMTKDRIKEEWDAFIAYPEGSGKLYVTTTSALLFAYLISSMTADAMLAASPDTQP